MKCPKCGFVGYPGIAQCKKCGHPFLSEKEKSSPIPSLFSGKSSLEGPSVGSLSHERVASAPPAVETVPLVESPINTPVTVSAGLTLPQPAPAPSGEVPAWRQELSQRVEDFRRRRARGRGTSDSNPNLELDFEEAPAPEAVPTAEIISEEDASAGPGIDTALAESQNLRSEPAAAHMDSVEIESALSARGALELPDLDRHEAASDAPLHRRPVEFVLDSTPRHADPEPAPVPVEVHMASMGRRFLGGIIDATVLLLAAGVFALIFWRAGGRMSAHPLNLAVVGLIAAFLVLAYFGAFTALISTTPGLLWMGIEVRNLRGEAPTLREASWRAFGYLVSSCALLLGFVWALVDSEGLTWHDRMSDTFLTTSDGAAGSRESRVES